MKCEHCGQELPEKKGIKNIKNLFKLDRSDIFWTFFFICLFYSAWAYQNDTKVCRDYALRADAIWMKLTNGTGQMKVDTGMQWWNATKINISHFIINDTTTTKNMTTINGS